MRWQTLGEIFIDHRLKRTSVEDGAGVYVYRPKQAGVKDHVKDQDPESCFLWWTTNDGRACGMTVTRREGEDWKPAPSYRIFTLYADHGTRNTYDWRFSHAMRKALRTLD